MEREQEQVSTMIEGVFGYYALQMGDTHRNLLASSPIATCARVGRSRRCELRSELHSLPVESSTVDLVVLAHALEFTPHPEVVMRESFRVLRPEGHLLVLGFNPSGMYGLRRRLDITGGYPWYGNFIFPGRVKDWFAVLGLLPVHGAFLGYAPPAHSMGTWAREAWEAAGDRWWPLLGGVFILQAIKRVPAMRLVKPRWQDKARKGGVVANAVERNRLS